MFAASVTFSASSSGFESTIFNDSKPLSAFDPALGTLISVTFELDGASTGAITVNNQSGQDGTYDVTLNGQLKLKLGSTTFITTLPNTEDPSFFVSGTGSHTATDNLSTLPITLNSVTTTTNLSQFIGPSGNPGTLAFIVNGIASGGAAGNTPNNVSTTASDSYFASITYNYTVPSTTPEPATMTLFGSALLGIGFFGRKKLKKN